MKLNQKYVFHIPLYKFEKGSLVKISTESLIEELAKNLSENGFDSFYMSKIKSYYKKRCYDEITLTLFTSEEFNPENIFKEWFKNNNRILKQEAFAYELNNTMIIEEL